MSIATASAGTITAPRDGRYRAAVTMAVLAFFIYAGAALTVHIQRQTGDFIPERSSIAAAVSNLYYGAKLGTVYSGILDSFLTFGTPLPDILDRAARHTLPTLELKGTTADGNGIGYMVVARESLLLFGPHMSSVVLGMLLLMGLSTAAFVSRFRDRRLVVVPLYFTALTIMLFTPLVSDHGYAANISIASIRYFSVVAVLPALHLIFECADNSRLRIVPGTVQVIILVMTVLVRNSAATVIGAIFAACLLFAWQRRSDRQAIRRLLGKGGYLTLVSMAFVGLLMLSVSHGYIANGRFTETIWHRIFVSLGLNPQWPYGDVRTIYQCGPYIPEGIVPGADDRNGHCILWSYAIAHHIPIDEVPTMTYGGKYDAILRDAFFHIAHLYPVQVLQTFILYKPGYIFWSMGVTADFALAGAGFVLISLLIASLCNLAVFAWVAWPSLLRVGAPVAIAIGLLGLFSLPPYFAVWAMPHTSADLFLYCLLAVGLAAGAGIEKIHEVMSHLMGSKHLQPR